MDSLRTRLEINVIVYRCAACGCLQIKNGGPDAPGVYKPTHPGWNPFKTVSQEPPCRPGLTMPECDLVMPEVSCTESLSAD
jgi:hypothetical protein